MSFQFQYYQPKQLFVIKKVKKFQYFLLYNQNYFQFLTFLLIKLLKIIINNYNLFFILNIRRSIFIFNY